MVLPIARCRAERQSPSTYAPNYAPRVIFAVLDVKYAGVRGEQRFELRGNKVIDTFHFID